MLPNSSSNPSPRFLGESRAGLSGRQKETGKKPASLQSEDLLAVLAVPWPWVPAPPGRRGRSEQGVRAGAGPQAGRSSARTPGCASPWAVRTRPRPEGGSPNARMCGLAQAWISDFSPAHPHPFRNPTGQRGHLRAHGIDVRLVVQALRVVGHVVAQLEQTVRKALKDRIALAGCSHGLHQVRYGEEGTPVSSARTPPCSPQRSAACSPPASLGAPPR